MVVPNAGVEPGQGRRSRTDRRNPLGRWFAAFALTICIGINAGFALNAAHERNAAIEAAHRSVTNLAEALGEQASETLDAVDGSLRTIKSIVVPSDTTLPSRIWIRSTMRALMAAAPRISQMAVFDENGRLVVSSFALSGVGLPAVGDRPYFVHHRENRGLGMVISGPGRNRHDNSWVIWATRRINHPNGSFAGIVLASISLDLFDRSYANVNVGRLGTITLFAEDGMILTRTPRAFIGHRFSDSAITSKPYRHQQSGWYIRASHLDGVTRLFAFRRLRHYPVVTQVAVAESEYLADWWTSTRINFLVYIAIVITIGGTGAALWFQIGRRKLAEEDLRRMALNDALTGIANRRQFDDVLNRQWQAASRHQQSLALLMIDVDEFKIYNDSYGHDEGDKALAFIAQTIGVCVRAGDLAARYGGEEFAVILSAADVPTAVRVADRIRAAVSALNIAHKGTESGTATVSIGVAAVVPTPFGDASALVKLADLALYDAKRAGRNRTSVVGGNDAAVQRSSGGDVREADVAAAALDNAPA